MLELPSVVLMLNCCPDTELCVGWRSSSRSGVPPLHDPIGHRDDDAFACAPYIEGGTHGRDCHVSNRHCEWPRRILCDSKKASPRSIVTSRASRLSVAHSGISVHRIPVGSRWQRIEAMTRPSES